MLRGEGWIRQHRRDESETVDGVLPRDRNYRTGEGSSLRAHEGAARKLWRSQTDHHTPINENDARRRGHSVGGSRNRCWSCEYSGGSAGRTSDEGSRDDSRTHAFGIRANQTAGYTRKAFGDTRQDRRRPPTLRRTQRRGALDAGALANSD